MQNHTLHLSSALTSQEIQDLSDLLLLVLEVRRAVFQAGGQRVLVSFDVDVVTAAEIEFAVKRAGYPILTEARETAYAAAAA